MINFDTQRATLIAAGKAISRAVERVRHGRLQPEVCFYCQGLLGVMGSPPSRSKPAWFVTCPCGKSKTTVIAL